jgi:hypothetical protein
MLSVKCGCEAVSTFTVLEGKLLHLGSLKRGYGKHLNGAREEARCLWCGFKFSKIEEAVAIAKARKERKK